MGIRVEETKSEVKSEVGEDEMKAGVMIVMSWRVSAKWFDSEFDI